MLGSGGGGGGGGGGGKKVLKEAIKGVAFNSDVIETIKDIKLRGTYTSHGRIEKCSRRKVGGGRRKSHHDEAQHLSTLSRVKRKKKKEFVGVWDPISGRRVHTPSREASGKAAATSGLKLQEPSSPPEGLFEEADKEVSGETAKNKTWSLMVDLWSRTAK